jgi:U2-associated protein SR140
LKYYFYSCFQLTKLFISGVVVYDYELKIGWGKSVALPSQALPAPPPGQMAIRSKEVASFVPKFLCAVLQLTLVNYLEILRK